MGTDARDSDEPADRDVPGHRDVATFVVDSVEPPSDGSPDGEGSVAIVETTGAAEDDANEITETVDRERPDVVAVELDDLQYRHRIGGAEDDEIDASDVVSGKTGYQFLGHWLTTELEQGHRDRTAVEAGGDTTAAVEAAASQGASVALLDRDLNDTTQRLWTRVGLREKFATVAALTADFGGPWKAGLSLGLFWGLLFGSIVSMLWGPFLFPAGFTPESAEVAGSLLSPVFSTLDAVVVIVGMGVVFGVPLSLVLASGRRSFEETTLESTRTRTADPVTVMLEALPRSPAVTQELLENREALIAHRLIALRKAGYDVVAVVDSGRRETIEGYLDTPATLPPVEPLVGPLESGRLRSIVYTSIGYAVTGALVVAFGLVALGGTQDGLLLQLFLAWFLVNFVAAAGIAFLAGAHWTSAGVGGAVAWLTSVNPMITPGLFIAYVELRHTTVKLSDVWVTKEVLGDRSRSLSSRLRLAHRDVGLFRLLFIMTVANLGSFFASVVFVTVLLPYVAADVGGLGGLGDELLDGMAAGLRVLAGVR